MDTTNQPPPAVEPSADEQREAKLREIETETANVERKWTLVFGPMEAAHAS